MPYDFPNQTPFDPPPPTWVDINGSGQTVGLVEFDNFHQSDIVNYLALENFSSSLVNQLSEVDINGGAPIGSGEPEVLIDIIAVLTEAPGAKVTVYDAPFAGATSTFQAVFNKMLDDGVSIISNSWFYCESQSDSADAASIDSIMASASMAGVSVFNATGDNGANCGGTTSAALPASSPNATAVGGSSLTILPGYVYGSETWWDGHKATPPTGQGGFGTSQFFPRPGYQLGLSPSSNRTVPDVVINADPRRGIVICQADAGGCPTGLVYGGTSLAAPEWAAAAALLNQGQGHNLGFFNPLIYPFANSPAFHSATSMNSDFQHVGLGSPDGAQLHMALTSTSAGPVSASISGVTISETASLANPVPTDPSTIYVVVVLRDSNGNPVGGKTVSLAANASSNTQITPSSATVSSINGAAVFTVTNPGHETTTFTATDTTDGIELTQTPSTNFPGPPAVAETLVAFPSLVTADGVTKADITVTLTDFANRPAVGKLVQLVQTGGSSVISGPNPPLTNASGQIEFAAVDSNNETITYSAIDVSDLNLAFPQSGSVTFNNAPEAGCANTFTAAPGFVAQPYATGFLAQNFCIGAICNSGCPGAFGIAFDASGNLYAVDQPTGNLYKFPLGGGVANSSTLLTNNNNALPGLDKVAIDSHGNLYGGVNQSGGSFTNGVVVQIDTTTGNVTRTVASGLTCPGLISVDPLSGDIFADDNCFGAGLNNTALWRISGPTTASPIVSTYTSLPGSPNGTIAFGPNGTIYVPTTVDTVELVQVSPTNGPTTPTLNSLSLPNQFGLGLLAFGAQPNGSAQFVVSSFNQSGNTPGGIGTFDLTGSQPSQSNTMITDNGQAMDMAVGPDGCVYAARGVAVWRITDSNGGCTYAAPNPSPSLSLTPLTTSPRPAQGSSTAMTASFNYATAPDGTPVTLNVLGANPQTLQSNTTGGAASFNYKGIHQGQDTVVATATFNNAALTSNYSVVTWTSGTDVTFLTLNQSPTSGVNGQPVTLAANLADVSLTPVAPIASQMVNFNLNGAGCSGATDSNGNATCQVTTAGNGIVTMSANFAGTAQYNPSSDSKGFNLLAAVATSTSTATGTPTPTATPSPTLTPTATPSSTVTPTAVPSSTPTPTTVPSSTPTPTKGGRATLVSPAESKGKPGSSVDLGSFSYAASDSAQQSISSVDVSVSKPRIFTSLKLIVILQGATVGTSSATGSALASTTHFTFSPPVTVAAGQSPIFALTGVISGGHSARLEPGREVAIAGIIEGSAHAPSATLMLALGLIGLCLMPMGAQGRRRASILAAVALLMVVGAAGCGGSSSSGAPAAEASRQEVVAIVVSEAGASVPVSGLPIDLGSIRKE